MIPSRPSVRHGLEDKDDDNFLPQAPKRDPPTFQKAEVGDGAFIPHDPKRDQTLKKSSARVLLPRNPPKTGHANFKMAPEGDDGNSILQDHRGHQGLRKPSNDVLPQTPPNRDNPSLKKTLDDSVESILDTFFLSCRGREDRNGIRMKREAHMNRVRSVDVLRGFSLICMVLIHFIIYWGNEATMHTWLYFMCNDLLADWGAPGFLLMMGISQVLSAAKTPDAAPLVLFKKTLLRSVYLFMIGLIMLGLAWGPEQIWQWDILTLMGFATLVLYFCRFLQSWLILVIATAIALATPWLRGLVDPVATWGGAFLPTPFISDYVPGLYVDPAHEFPSVWWLDMIFQGFAVSGTFPVFPWLIFPLIGFVLGRRIVAQRFQRDLPWLLFGGFLLIGLGLAGAFSSLDRPALAVVTEYLAPLCYYPNSFTLLLCQLGVDLVLISIFYYWYDVRPRNEAKIGFFHRLFNRTSRYSLTFYFLHFQLIGWPLLIVYAFTRAYLIFDFMDAWPALLSFLVAVTFLEWLLVLWDRHGGKYSLEWLQAVLMAQLVKADAATPEPSVVVDLVQRA